MYEYSCRVTRVVDGDTFELMLDMGLKVFHEITLRLEGIDTSEIYGTPKDSDSYRHGMTAKQFCEALLLDPRVKLVGETVKSRTGKDKKSLGRYRIKLYVVNESDKVIVKTNVADILKEMLLDKSQLNSWLLDDLRKSNMLTDDAATDPGLPKHELAEADTQSGEDE